MVCTFNTDTFGICVVSYAATSNNPSFATRMVPRILNFGMDSGSHLSQLPHIVPMIAGELRRFLRDNNSIRVSRSMRDLAYRALSVRETLSSSLGRDPSVEEITAKLCEEDGAHHTCEEVGTALEAISAPVSLFDPVYSDSSSGDALYIMDQIKDQDENDEAWLEGIVLRESLSKLSERERSIIELRFFSGRTQMEIASEIGISQAQVSRLEKGALMKIRKNF